MQVKIYNGTPLAKQSVPLEIQLQQLLINELNGANITVVIWMLFSHILKLHMGKEYMENYRIFVRKYH
jgi:hypothetical protein